MSEIEKMYENAGVEKSKCWDDCNTCTRTSCDKNISYVKAEYPPFTAEKQLEIVKFLLHKGVYYSADGDTYWFHYTDEIENATYRPFEEAIAEFINGFWQDLTEVEQQQVKGILE